MEFNPIDLKVNKDFIIVYPYGTDLTPQIEVIAGDYDGLVVDIPLSMYTTNFDEEHTDQNKMVYDYKIVAPWINIGEQKNGSTITLTEKDQHFLSSLVFHFIIATREYNEAHPHEI